MKKCEFCENFVKKNHRRFCSKSCYNKSPDGLARAKKAGLKQKGKIVSNEVKAKISSSLVGNIHTLETRLKMSRSRKGVKKTQAHIDKISEKVSIAAAEGRCHGKRKISLYISTKSGKEELSDSSYELRRFKALDASPLVKSWTKKHKIKIPYTLHGKRHRYIPDILIKYHDGRIVLEEVKGFVFDKAKFAAKNVAALLVTSMYENTTFRVVFGEQLEIVD